MSTVSLQQTVSQGERKGTWVAWEAGKTSVQGDGLMSSADASDATKSAKIFLEVTFDTDQKTVQQAGSYGWTGGINARTQGPNFPSLSAQYSVVQPKFVRYCVDSADNQSHGGQLTFS